MRRTKITASFDELIRNYYGGRSGARSGDSLRLDNLFGAYYGIPKAAKPNSRGKPSTTLSTYVDDGETIGVRQTACRLPAAQPRRPAGQPPAPVDVAAEYRVEIVEPLTAAPAPTSASAAPPLPSAKAPDDDFIADLESILKGKKVFQPPPSPPPLPAPEARNETAIFDRIAQSLQYANAYNLGTIELENRFADFDAISAIEQNASASRKQGSGKAAAGRPTPAIDVPSVDGSDFISDLDAIRAGFEHKPPVTPESQRENTRE